MPQNVFVRGLLTACCAALLASAAFAQTGRIGGTIKDDQGQPIKGATVTAENPQSSPSRFNAVSDDKGRYSIIGMKSGRWTFTAEAPGYAPQQGTAQVATIGAPNPPVNFTLAKGAAPAGATGPLSGISPEQMKAIQADLLVADASMNAGNFDQAIAQYQAINTKVPTLTAINLAIGQAAARRITTRPSALQGNAASERRQSAGRLGMTHGEGRLQMPDGLEAARRA
jgi:ABC-type amino acid transport substrate-binding protein